MNTQAINAVKRELEEAKAELAHIVQRLWELSRRYTLTTIQQVRTIERYKDERQVLIDKIWMLNAELEGLEGAG